MTKKVFAEPECEIVRFCVEDIITTSGEDSWLITEIGAPTDLVSE